ADIAHVIYLDHRGCGRSTGAPETWTLDTWADDLAAFLEAHDITAPWVFGQSFGGMVAMHFAARHPQHVSKLILSSTAARFDVEATVAKATDLGGSKAGAAARRLFTDPTPEAYAHYADICLPLYSQTPAADAFRAKAIHRPEVTVHFFANEMKKMDLRPGLATLTMPTLVLAGAEDPVTPTPCARQIAQARGPEAQLHIFEGCGHGPHRDKPDETAEVMRAFLLG
ncbi:MAG: alpha/beta hydrolase, partial [Pseudomonadota bacterium]